MGIGSFGQKEFKECFDDHAEKVRNFIYYKCGDIQLAEDIMQEAFLRLWKGREKVDPEKAKSYVYTVSNNLFLDNARHKQVVLKYQNQPTRDTDKESPQHVLEQKEFKEALEKAINDLPETQREVFLLNRIEKMTYQEIADRLGVSVKAIEKRMGKALKRMRKLTDRI